MEELATGYGLIEGPVWDDDRGLIYSDVINGGVRALSESGEISTIVPKRRGVGGMAPHAAGGLVIGGREIIYESFDGETHATLLTPEVTDVAIGFNDLTTDEAGRVWVGSLAFRVILGEEVRPGHLHVVDLDGTGEIVERGLALCFLLDALVDRVAALGCDVLCVVAEPGIVGDVEVRLLRGQSGRPAGDAPDRLPEEQRRDGRGGVDADA